MKKTFPLRAEGRDDARVRDKIRQEINRYLRRERQKPLPEGADQWDFACKVGPSADAAESMPLKAVAAAIDQVGLTGAAEIYIEIVARATTRPPR
jgi:hypothetical protein